MTKVVVCHKSRGVLTRKTLGILKVCTDAFAKTRWSYLTASDRNKPFWNVDTSVDIATLDDK